MLWGATVRSPHPHARIVSIDVGPALAITGVHAALVASDIPGVPRFGQKEADQPVLADGEVRFWGEAVCVVAADDREAARRAAAAVVVVYEPLEPLTDSEEAARRGETFRTLEVVNGDQSLRGEVAVEGYYEVGVQDQAMLGTESGLAVPDGEGGVDLYISTQWMHVDHRQIVACLGLRPEQVRLHLAGIGGAFGAREDLTLQIHLCLLALHTGRPVKMVYDRAESFAGHVHRHPARLWYRHEADRQGNLVRVEARIILDGGAYEETSGAVRGQLGLLRRRPLPLPLGEGRRRRRPHQQPARRGRCAASGPTRSASPTRRRWTASPPPWAWTRSTCACATPWATATACPPPTRRSPGACPPPR